MPLKIVVCMKLVPDPEGPPDAFSVDQATNRVTVQGLPPVANPYDENALEAALRVKESLAASGGQARITVLSLGRKLSGAVILKAVATGADDSVLIEDDLLDSQELDSFATASILARVLARLQPDLVLTGRQASDSNAGQVGPGVAQKLGVPAITLARKVEVSGDRVRVERVLPDGFEVVRAPLPALVTVSHEVGDLRYPALASIKAAKQLPRETVGLAELELDPAALRLVERDHLSAPDRERSCKTVPGDGPEEVGLNLAGLLIADRVL